jgi:hypothetical protein
MALDKKHGLVVALGAAGIFAAVTATTLTPAIGVGPATPAPIHSVRNNGPVNLKNGDTTLVKLKLPAGHWLISGKMWADSQANQSNPNTVVGCHLGKGGAALDSSAFNTPKVGGSGGSSAGVIALQAVIRLRSSATISLQCNDFGSNAVAHSVVLSAVG